MTVSAPDNGFNARPHQSRKKSCFVARKHLTLLSYPPRQNFPRRVDSLEKRILAGIDLDRNFALDLHHDRLRREPTALARSTTKAGRSSFLIDWRLTLEWLSG
jgi:hypothetical protein